MKQSIFTIVRNEALTDVEHCEIKMENKIITAKQRSFVAIYSVHVYNNYS